MHTFDTGRAEARSRANRRLRTMTIGTAILGVTTTGVLGWAAAITNDGSAATAGTSTATSADTAVDTAADTATTGATSSTAAASSAPSVSGSSGAAHAATGGS